MKKIFIVSFIVILFFLIAWPYLNAEILTVVYGNEFNGLLEKHDMFNSPTYFKVIRYSDSDAKVFYVHSKKGGCIVSYKKKENQWEISSWKMIWSEYGSADEFYWPYYK